VWGVLSTGRWFVERSRNVARHGDVDEVELEVPGESEAAVESAGPIEGDGVEELKSVDEVLGMVFADILDAEVVDN
jgi:hypothetical protein